MKRLILLLTVISLLFTAVPVPTGTLASAQGVDLFRGAWGGTLATRTPTGELLNAQLNVYLDESVPGGTPGSFKASGYSSITWEEPDKPKRAKAESLPIIARYTDTGNGTFDITILATFPTPPWAPVPAKVIYTLRGVVRMSGSGVPDDVIEGQWSFTRRDGTIVRGNWSVVHLDWRSIQAPEVSLNDPTLYFRVDTVAHLRGPAGPAGSRNPQTWADTYTNIVMDSVRVTFPDGTTKILPPYTDVYSPQVPRGAEFRFAASYAGLPAADGTYTFTALDVAGNPIPGVQGTDIWVGPPTVPPPDPPSNTLASLVVAPKPGIFVSWGPVSNIPGSFGPPAIGDYRIEIFDQQNNMLVYAASGLGSGPMSHLVPRLKADFISGMDWGASLAELATGKTYRLTVLARSLAPVGSAGRGAEYNVRISAQYWFFDVLADGSLSNLHGPITLPQAPEAKPLFLKAKTFELNFDRTNYTIIWPLNEDAEVWATVKNTSDKADTIIFESQNNPSGWLIHPMGASTIYLGAGQSGRALVYIVDKTGIGPSTPMDNISVNFTATSRSNPDSTASFSITVGALGLHWNQLPANATISGRVYDKVTGAPIAGATVVTKLWSRGTEQQTTANFQGYFRILVPPFDWLSQEVFQKFGLHYSANYVVAVHAPGYHSSYKPRVRPMQGGSVSLDFGLEKLKVSASFGLSWEKELEYPGVWTTVASDDWNHLAVAMGAHAESGATNVYAFDSAGNRQWSYPIGNQAWGIDITHDGAKVAVGSVDKNVYVFNWNGNLLWNYTSDTVREVRFSHNGSYLAFGPTRRGAEWFGLFNAATGEMLWERRVDGWTRYVAFAEDDSLIAVGADKNLFVFDIQGNLKWRQYLAGFPFYVGISSDLSRIFVIDKGQLLSVFDGAGNLLWSYTIEVPTEGAMSRDGSRIAVLNIRGAVFTFDGDGNLLWNRVFQGAGHEGLSMTRDGKYIVVGGGMPSYPFWTALLTSGGTLLWENRIPVIPPPDIHPYGVATMHVAMSEDYTRIVSGYGFFRPALRLFRGSISPVP